MLVICETKLDDSIACRGLQTDAVYSIEHVSFNLFLISGPILYPLKTPGDFWFSGVFWGREITIDRSSRASKL